MGFPHSFLFVPGDRPDRFDKAAASGADQVILDLEDAVQPQGKAQARAAIAAWAGRENAVVRINGADSPWFEEDLAFVGAHGLRKLMVPKAEPVALERVAQVLGGDGEVLALIETVAGLMQVREVCASAVRPRLAFGNLDFSLDAGMSETSGELDPVRLQLALESRFGGLLPPVDGVLPSLSDPAALAEQIRRAKALGFGGKLCIHPAQVAVVNDGWRPSEAELDWARRVLAAVEAAGSGAISLDGKMVDRPVVERARIILGAEE